MNRSLWLRDEVFIISGGVRFMLGLFGFLEGESPFLQSESPKRALSMKKKNGALKSCLTLVSLAFFAHGLQAADLEDVYQSYLQGNYAQAQETLTEVLGTEPKGEELLEMKKRVGMRALLEMSQNQFLRNQMKFFNSVTWQKERSQFKSPRRIKYFVQTFMDDDSTRHRSMPNILASGSYAIPHIIEYLKVDNEDIRTRTLAYQLLLNMGSEAVPSLTACTFSDDPILQLNAIRLLTKTRSQRAVPYLLRLKVTSSSRLAQEELAIAFEALNVPMDTSPARSYIDEANRYLAEMEGVDQEAVESDRLLWRWDKSTKGLVADNPLGFGFEYQAQYPLSLWALFKAELMHRQFADIQTSDLAEKQAIQAASLCSWVAQEHRLQELLSNTEIAGVQDLEEALQSFLEFRSEKLTLAHWMGTGVLLQALDMSERAFPPHVAARILRMIAGYQPKNVENEEILSFVSGETTVPLQAGLSHRQELIRYWSAITIARCDRKLMVGSSAVVVDLLRQAIDEVGIASVLLVSKPTPDAQHVKAKLEDMGYLVEMVVTEARAMAGLRSYPSKDMVIIDPDFGYGNDGLSLMNALREDPKGKDLPIVILSDEERNPKHVITFQEQAEEIIFGSDSSDILRGKFAELASGRLDVTGPDMAGDVSHEALSALALLDVKAIRAHEYLVPHLANLIESPYQPESSQILAIRALRKMGPLAAPATPELLAKLEQGKELSYQIVVLHALLEVSKSNEKVRGKLYSIVTDPSSPNSFKQMAASYLSSEGEALGAEERLKYQKTFFSSAFLNDSGR